MLIDHISKEIDHLKTLADYFADSTRQNANLNKAIEKTRKLIDVQNKAEKKYSNKGKRIFRNYKYETVDSKGKGTGERQKLFTKKGNKSKNNKQYSEKTFNKYWKKIQEGKVDLEVIKDKNLAAAIKEAQEFWDKSLDARYAVQELKNEIIDLNKQKLDNIIDDFEKFTSYVNSFKDIAEENIKLFENQGKSTQYSIEQLQNEAEVYRSIMGRTVEIKAYEAEMQKQLADNPFGSERWKEAYTNLNSMRKALIEAANGIYEVRERVRELNWQPFNIAIDILGHLDTQLNNVLGLVGDFSTFQYGKGSALTEMGITQMNLYADAMKNSRKQVAQYKVALKALDEERKNGIITEKQYNEEVRQYNEKILESANSVQKYRSVIINYIKDGINKETEAMSELISKRKEALSRQKEADAYAKSVRDKTRDINKIRRQIAAMSGDDTDATKARVKQLNEQLREAQEELDETRKDHQYDMINQGLDDQEKDFKEKQDKRIADLESSLQAQNEAINSALAYTTAEYAKTANILEGISAEFGVELEKAITEPWDSAGKAMLTFIESTTALENVAKKIDDLMNVLSSETFRKYQENKKEIEELQKKIDAISKAIEDTENILHMRTESGEIATIDSEIERLQNEIAEKTALGVDDAEIQALQIQLDKLVEVRDYNLNNPENPINIPVEQLMVDALKDKMQEIITQRDNLKDENNKLELPTDDSTIIDLAKVLTEIVSNRDSLNENSISPTVDDAALKSIETLRDTLKEAAKYKAFIEGKTLADDSGNENPTGDVVDIDTSEYPSVSDVPQDTGGQSKIPSTTKNNSVASSEEIAPARVASGDRAGQKYKTIDEKYKFRKKPKSNAEYAIQGGKLKKGTKVVSTGVSALEGKKEWIQVKYNGTKGWIQKKGLKKARLGTKAAQRGLYLTDEQGVGSEAILTKGGVLRQLDAGDTVFNAKQRETLWEMSKLDLKNLPGVGSTNMTSVVNNNYESLLTVNGNVDKETLPKLQDILKQACEYTKRDIYMNQKKMGLK